MANLDIIWNTFNAGELSPLLDGRTDQDKYFAGCSLLRNFLPTVQGPASRRGGTRYTGATKDSGRAWFLAFSFSVEQSYVLEFGENYLRFWVNRGQLLTDGDVPYEIETPWASADLITAEGTFALRAEQENDIMWICHQHGRVPVHKLSRLGATNWTLEPVVYKNGPFRDVDPDSTVTVTPSGVEGAITLTSTDSDTFPPELVGTPFYLEAENPAEITPWEAERDQGAVGAVVRWEGNVYEYISSLSGNNAGQNPPVHTEGDGSDGNITWRYLHSGYGWGTITAATGANADMTVTKRLPDQTITGTTRWARAVFNDQDGHPTAIASFRERLVLARDRTVCMSMPGLYDDFSPLIGPDITSETGLVLNLKMGGNLIRWISEFGDLIIGTAGGERAISERNEQQALAIDNIKNTSQTEYGSRLIEPLHVGSALLFVQRAGRKFREMQFSFESARYKADDLTVLSPHVTDTGVVDMDYQQEPDNIVWCALANGSLAALTYNRERGVVAWTLHPLGGAGFVESVCCIPAPDGGRDDPWLIVRRTVNGEEVRYIEIIEDPRLVEADVRDGFYVDCGLSYDGEPSATITGLEHLEGETVDVLVDGTPHAQRVVEEGAIALSRAGSKVQVGLHEPARLVTMRMDGGAENGTAQGARKSVSDVTLRLYQTLGGRVGPTLAKTDAIPGLRPSSLVGALPTLFTGDVTVVVPAEFGTDGRVCVIQEQPLPITVSAIIAHVTVND
jgi:hypothetical protein